jgi:hypothetical protein
VIPDWLVYHTPSSSHQQTQLWPLVYTVPKRLPMCSRCCDVLSQAMVFTAAASNGRVDQLGPWLSWPRSTVRESIRQHVWRRGWQGWYIRATVLNSSSVVSRCSTVAATGWANIINGL